MVQAIENRSVATCQPVGDVTDGPHREWVTVPVSVVEAEAVEGYPNLLGKDLPRSVVALVRRDVWQKSLADHATWRAEVELVDPGKVRVRRPLETRG